MFYTTFAELCSRRGIRPGRAAGEIGISRAAVTRWKQEGFTPRGDVLERIAAYFGVTVDYLLRGGDSVQAPDGSPDAADTSGEEEEMEEFLEMLKNRQECRMLFSLARNATRSDVERAVKIIEALREVEQD